jgi:hypothetical protein
MNMSTQPKSGTNKPVLRVPERFDIRPTNHGSSPPPTFDRTNMMEAMPEDADPNSFDKSEMVMG